MNETASFPRGAGRQSVPDFAKSYWRSAAAPEEIPAELSTATLDDRNFRLLADNIPTLCWIARGDGYIVWYNRRWHDYCGTTPAEMEGWGWQKVHDPDLLPSVMERWAASVATGAPFEMIFPLRGADGVFRPFLTRIQPVRDANGQVIRWFGVNTDISDQIGAERALRQERDRTHDVLQNMGEGFALLDRAFRVVDINAEALRLDQRSREDVVGRSHWQLWPGSEQSELGLLFKRAMAERCRVSLEHRFVWPTGRAVWLETRAFPSGEGIAVFVRDVTERKAAEALQAQSEARFRTVGETMPGFVWTADANGQLDYTSRTWHAYSGAGPDASNGRGWAEFVHPHDQAATFAAWAESVAHATPYEVEFRLRRADGAYRWWLARARPSEATEFAVSADGGSPAARRWIGVCTDLDDIVAARETLARSSAQLAEIVAERTQERDRIWRLVPDLLMTISAEGRLLSVNPAWREALGWTEADLLAQPLQAFAHTDHRAGIAAALQQLAAGLPVRVQTRLCTADGDDRWFDWVGAAAGDRFYGVLRDITEAKRREAALAQAEDALRQSQKMEAVGQLTGGIAHDFNNMLAIVIGSLDLLRRREGALDGRSARQLDAALDGARRAAGLTSRLLAFARQQPLQPRPTDVDALIAGMSDLLQRALGSQVQIDTVLEAGPGRIEVDPNQLEHVILNLGLNARDAMPEGGRLSIRTGRGARAEGGWSIVIAVTDSGTGMAPEVLARAFDPFFTTKAVGAGSGLGLSQVYGFVRQSGGEVRIESQPGRGTTVRIELPGLAQDRLAPADEDASSAVPAGGGELVLVVDDEAALRRLSVEALADLGYRVIEAEDAGAALRLLETTAGVDLLFTDVVMPDMDGARLAARALALHPQLRILLTTGFPRDAVTAGEVRGAGILAKPFTVAELASRVRQALDQTQ